MLGSSTPQWSLQGVCETCVHTYHTAVLSDTVFVWRLGTNALGPARGLRFDTSCNGVPEERNCISMDMAMVIVGINLCYSMVCIPLACTMRHEKNFHTKLNQQLYPKVNLN